MTELKDMTKENLIKLVEKLKNQVENNQSGPKRKYQVLDLLKQRPHTIAEMAKIIGISNANISSQLTYLRQQDNIKIYTDDLKRKFLAE